jgi:hypothetical protein
LSLDYLWIVFYSKYFGNLSFLIDFSTIFDFSMSRRGLGYHLKFLNTLSYEVFAYLIRTIDKGDESFSIVVNPSFFGFKHLVEKTVHSG